MPPGFALGSAAKGILSSLPAAPAEPAIQLPADHYAHPGAPTEWWWNVGTLQAGDRTFGFEINADSSAGQGGFGFTQVMLSDVSNNQHYQQTTPYLPGVFNCATWAESDPTQDWFVAL